MQLRYYCKNIYNFVLETKKRYNKKSKFLFFVISVYCLSCSKYCDDAAFACDYNIISSNDPSLPFAEREAVILSQHGNNIDKFNISQDANLNLTETIKYINLTKDESLIKFGGLAFQEAGLIEIGVNTASFFYTRDNIECARSVLAIK